MTRTEKYKELREQMKIEAIKIQNDIKILEIENKFLKAIANV